jgi:hypothetical protein
MSAARPRRNVRACPALGVATFVGDFLLRVEGRREQGDDAGNESTHWDLASLFSAGAVGDSDVTGGDGNIYTSLNTKDVAPLYGLVIEPDEIWQLQYDITAENARRVLFFVKISVKNGTAVVEKIR